MTLELRIDAEVSAAFPAHSTALLRVTADAPLRPRDGAIEDLVQRFGASSVAAVRAAEHWRAVFAAMGAKPKYGSSVQKLHELQRSAGDALPIPLELVELYCWFSLVHGVPMAGYRPGEIAGVLRLSVPGAGVPFVALGQARGSQEKTKPREVAYIDDEKAICRYWNYRDCDQTKLVEGIDDALFVFDLVDERGLCGADDGPDLAARFAALLDGEPRTSTAVATPETPFVVLADTRRAAGL